MKKLTFIAALVFASVSVFAQKTAPDAAPTAPTWPGDQVEAVYSATYGADCNFGEWGSGTQYTQEAVGKKFVTGDLGYFGLEFLQALNVITMEKLHLDVWIAADASIRIVPIWGGAEQGITVSLTGGKWNAIDLAKEDFNQINDWSNVIQIKIDNAKNLTFWLNNVYFYRTTAISDNEKPTDVQAALASASYFSVLLNVSAKDNSGAVNFTVKNGDEVVANGGGASGAAINLNVPNLKPNTDYVLSVIASDAKGNEADPVSVNAKTLAAPAPAPAPDLSDKTAVAIFCDAIAGAPSFNIGGWSQKTQASIVELVAGDHVCFGSDFNYLGWEINGTVDASEMEFLHIDFYTNDMTKISFTPISAGHEGSASAELIAGQWTKVDVALSVFAAANIEWNKIFQFKFMDATPEGKELFIDNVYFYKEGSTAIDNAAAANVKVQKVMENGQLVIIKDGVRYNANGTVVK